ncbi:endo-alpha-N-acetylgalactosaminidase family protein [Bifidobacterium longum]|uniref:endo-alpha-N-acetylgalactosaminidase family protein n=1 Tax=Bifidobacterium longum TaxID=216816 RepID=UPI001F0E1BE8|nr:endo-alpha-N-acetylgalactosaminidase family protein [Bifidobacterium longum]MCH4837852.1 endo-alpha-N-acetylgalactosaminidase family protein [Bifidobacterium longum]
MKKKKTISAALATALALTCMGSGGGTAFAVPLSDAELQTLASQIQQINNTSDSATASETPAAQADATEGWTIDSNIAKGGEILETVDGWLHFKSTEAHGNAASNPSPSNDWPAVAVWGKDYDFSKAGSFHATIKSPQEGKANRFGFYLGYKDPGSGLFIGYDSGGWFWQTYTGDGNGGWYDGNRIAAPSANDEHDIQVSWTDAKVATLTVDGQEAFDVDYSAMTNLSNKLAIKAGSWKSLNQVTDVYIKDFPEVVEAAKHAVSGKVVDAEGAAIEGATVRLDKTKVKTGADGTFSFADIEEGKHTLSIAKEGYEDVSQQVTVSGADLAIDPITLNKTVQVASETLKTEKMEVQIKKNFPSVLQYTMTDGKVMYGQSKDVRTVEINGTNIELGDDDVTFKKVSDTEATYTLKVKDEAKKKIDAVITVQITVKANQLHFNVTDIKNNLSDGIPEGNGVEKNAIQTLSFPNQSLISVRSSQDGAQFTGTTMSSNTQKPGDENFAVTEDTNYTDRDYTYGFISGAGLSAGLWSNSEHDGRAAYADVRGGSQNTRVYATTQQTGDATSLGLASAPWYYHRTVTDSKGKKYTVAETAMPQMAVAIAGDENKDGAVNWQDGAIAYRDIMNNPYKSEEVPELVAWRIAMNFGSQAQNPFLTTLDNVKKVALNTDGLGQSVLLKGYGNEGHDSGHPDYGDIGQRLGGADDMNTLMEEGSEYGARFGVHVNASEMYPEAKAFSEDMVRRNSAGGLSYGWNWLDQGIGIDGIYDLASGSRVSRFADLSKEVGDNMDFIYLDVWGNLTSSGSEDSWETRKMSKMINDNGWRMTTEWGSGNEYDSTFQHWAADLTYGGSALKGENSEVMRFLRNHQKDSWVGDYPAYGGAANAPLLGGYNMKDFEGWQGRNDYAAYIENLFTHDVSTKFIQHFKVTRWVNNPLLTEANGNGNAVIDPKTNNGNEQITLKDGNGNVVVLSRGSNDSSSAAYRQRTITLNGVTVASGVVSAGDGSATGDESYLLPWMWDSSTGKLVKDSEQKLYHWNTKGGTTIWTLPDSWKNLSSVKVYQLTDQGKTNEQTVAVSGGKVTLTADAETPYVVYKGEAKQIQVNWSEGMHVVDAGFNGGSNTLTDNWTVAGTGKAEVEGDNNAMLRLTGKVDVSQRLTDLKAGQKYALYVGVDNRSTGDASVTVTSGGKVLATNSTGKSIAKNYIKAYGHNTNSNTENGSSYFQNMYVFFTAPENGDATVTLSHKSTDEAHTYFDDVRIVENKYSGITLDENGELKSLTHGFENNAQGIWPFVVSGSEGVEDNRIHLSELHAPYTQAGWDVKKMDDVLDGTWSVKVNGLTQKGTLVYQTIPQNVKFEPGAKYKVSFDYQSGSDDTYAIAVGQGEYSAGSVKLTNLKKALGETGTAEFELTGGVNGDSWFGIYSTATAPDLQGSTGRAQDFGGYKDFVLDNLKIERVDSQNRTKAEAQAKLKEIRGEYDSKRSEFSEDAWNTYQANLVKARVLIDKDGATAEDYTKAYDILVALDEYMKSAPGNEGSDAYDVAADGSDHLGGYTVEVGSEEPSAGLPSEGPAYLAQDGNGSTHWHTSWSANAVDDGTAWYQFNLNKPTTINGLRYLPRSGGMNANGKIKGYRITLTLANGTTKGVVTDAKFSTSTMWQKASFDAVENVTAVRLTVLSSAGQSDSQANKFASAAELRLTTNREVEEETVAPDKTDLNDTIAQANGLKESDYTAESWAALVKAREAAQTVADDEKASAYDVALALANLESAIAGLEQAGEEPGPGPVEVNKTDLQAAVNKADKLEKADYTAGSWDVFAKALKDAKQVLGNENATQQQVDDALKTLQDAISKLEAATKPKPEPGVVDKAALNATINKAAAINLGLYTDDSANALRAALKKAREVSADNDATQKQVDAAREALEKAIAALVKRPAAKGDGNVVSNTGSNVATIALAGLLLAGAGAAIAYRRNREQL